MFEITEKNPEISGVFAWMQLSFRRVIFIPTAVHIGVFDAPLLEADGHDKRIVLHRKIIHLGASAKCFHYIDRNYLKRIP